MGIRGAIAAIVVVLAGAAHASAGDLSPNPANHKKLIGKPMDSFRYDRATGCRQEPPRGTRAMTKWLDRTVRGTSWGIIRCERLGSGWSVHSEGRAIDWHLDARVRSERRAAMRLIRTLIEEDRRGQHAALARRMGVQGLIFNCKTWWGGTGLGKYSYCYRSDGTKRKGLDPTQAHKDHIHLELNWKGARKRTSFWNSPLARPGA